MGKPESRAGYTLVELLVVCAVLGLVLLLAVPSLAATRDLAQLRGATAVISADLRQAQALAVHQGKLARVVFDTASGIYQVQQARDATAGLDCADTNFEPVKIVNLPRDFKAILADPTFRAAAQPTLGCIVFEPSSRTDWVNPMFRGVTYSAAGAAVMGRFLDNQLLSEGTVVGSSDDYQSVLWWEADVTGGWVSFTFDFGRYRYIQSISPDIVEDTWSSLFPTEEIRVSTSAVVTDTLPAEDQWVLLPGRKIAEADKVRFDATWARACPTITVDRPTRYLRLQVKANSGLAIDEIKFPWPQITVKNLNGRASRTIMVSPNTGMVSVR